MTTTIRNILIITLLSVMCLGVKAQHSAVMSQYMFNGLVLNPAYAGSQKTMAFNLNYRNQWAGFAGAPKAQMASFHSPLKGDKIALGGIITREESGISNDLSAMFVAAYHLKVDKGTIQFGLGGGLGMGGTKWSEATIEEEGDPLFENDIRGLTRPIFSTGVYYQNRKWYAGYSMPSLLKYDYPTYDQINFSFSPLAVEHMFTAGYAYKIKRSLVVKPSFLLRTIPEAGMQFDLNANLIFNDKLWTGLSYRLQDAVVAMVEYQVHYQLRVGYAYDYKLGPIGSYSSGSHEIMMMWAFRKQSFARNPRYF